MSDAAFLSLEKLTLAYGDTVAVKDLDLSIRKGELVAFLGPSGCGKTTTMRSIAGLLSPASGAIRLDGADITRVSANKRSVGLVFQSYALFPHLTVFENVAFGLRLKKLPATEIESKVTTGLKSVGLSKFSARKPGELSGGQQQRVALARSMVMEPKVLLLDEPLAALDKKLRTAMQIELQTLQRELGITFVLVTHDQEEALSMSDFVCVMNAGRIVQVGPPQEIYDRPASLFVADFVGKTNRIDATVDGASSLVLANGARFATPAVNGTKGAATVALRPEAIRLTRNGAASADALAGTVTHRIFLGSAVEYSVAVDGLGDFLVTADRRTLGDSELVEPGEKVGLAFDPNALHVFPA